MSRAGYEPSEEKRENDARLRRERCEAMLVIRNVVADQGRMQIWLAEKAQVRRTCLWNYLYGVSRMPQDVWDRICRAMKLEHGRRALPRAAYGRLLDVLTAAKQELDSQSERLQRLLGA